jgi:hypothetical protein
MRKIALPLLFLLLLSVFSVAQTTPDFTESTAQTCQLATANCNGLPLDQGGTWQMLLGNNEFSISNVNFTVHGGLQVTSNTVPRLTAYENVGPTGEIDFDWTATNPNTQVAYTGTAKVPAHYIRICGRYCRPTLKVDAAEIVVNP